ncbi:hypothetical protein E4U42_006061, partial [Claviceps africana]
MKLIVVFSLVTAVLANGHKNCVCYYDGAYIKDLSSATCDYWTNNLFAPTHWDGYS